MPEGAAAESGQGPTVATKATLEQAPLLVRGLELGPALASSKRTGLRVGCSHRMILLVKVGLRVKTPVVPLLHEWNKHTFHWTVCVTLAFPSIRQMSYNSGTSGM